MKNLKSQIQKLAEVYGATPDATIDIEYENGYFIVGNKYHSHVKVERPLNHESLAFILGMVPKDKVEPLCQGDILYDLFYEACGRLNVRAA